MCAADTNEALWGSPSSSPPSTRAQAPQRSFADRYAYGAYWELLRAQWRAWARAAAQYRSGQMAWYSARHACVECRCAGNGGAEAASNFETTRVVHNATPVRAIAQRSVDDLLRDAVSARCTDNGVIGDPQ